MRNLEWCGCVVGYLGSQVAGHREAEVLCLFVVQCLAERRLPSVAVLEVFGLGEEDLQEAVAYANRQAPV